MPGEGRLQVARSPEPGGLEGQVVLFWQARRAARRSLVARHSGLGVAEHLEEMGTHGVQPIVARQPFAEGFEQHQPSRGPMRHRRSDRPVERHHRIAGHPFEQAVQPENLRPVGVLDACRLIVNGCDRGLDLVLTHGPPGERVLAVDGVGEADGEERVGLAHPTREVHYVLL